VEFSNCMKKVCYSFEKEKYAKTNCINYTHQCLSGCMSLIMSIFICSYRLLYSVLIILQTNFWSPRSFLFAADGAINRIMSSNTQFYYLSVSIITTLYSSLMFIYTDLIAKLLSIQKKEVTIAVVTYLPLYDWQGLWLWINVKETFILVIISSEEICSW